MPSRVIMNPEGGGRILHIRRAQTQPKCHCGATSHFQCDFHTEGGRTCDRHMCVKHRNFVTAGIDYCDAHMKIHRERIAKGKEKS